jgi:hypothetical protein
MRPRGRPEHPITSGRGMDRAIDPRCASSSMVTVPEKCFALLHIFVATMAEKV